jgi:hypothetical protein
LPDFGADSFEQEPHVPDHGIVAQDRMAFLPQIMDANGRKRRKDCKGQQHPRRPQG